MIDPARWIGWSALVAAAAVPFWGTGARGQAADSLLRDSTTRRLGADSVPATGGWLPRLVVPAYVGTIRADAVVPTAPVFQFTDLLTARFAGCRCAEWRRDERKWCADHHPWRRVDHRRQ